MRYILLDNSNWLPAPSDSEILKNKKNWKEPSEHYKSREEFCAARYLPRNNDHHARRHYLQPFVCHWACIKGH